MARDRADQAVVPRWQHDIDRARLAGLEIIGAHVDAIADDAQRVRGVACIFGEVLAYFARNAGKVMLHRQVLQAVWGGNYGDEADYVWTYVQRLRRKIEPDRGTPHYLLTEARVGYHMPLPDSDARVAQTGTRLAA